jgi:Mrp family chromosome partitioning ATPase
MLKLKRTKKDIPGAESLLVNFSSKSRYAESYRTLRTNIYFSLMEKDLHTLVVTSALPGEGKTTTVANLAYTIAQTGKRVLMVDADLRKPGLSSRFGLQKANGFSNIIADVLGRHVNSGNVSDYGLKDLIKLNNLQQRNCILTIVDGTNEAELFFLKGELVDVYWKNRPDNQKLASTLVREKLLTENEARLALGHQKKSVRRLGSVLLTLGLLEAKDLNKILSVQMMEAFRVATEMENATFTVRTIAEDEIQLSSLGTIDMSQLSKEFLSADSSDSFIKKEIDSNILETEEKNLYLLPSGSIPPNPSELIGSPRTSYLFKLLKNKFDVVIVDSSPIIPASDVLLLSPQVDGVVFVVQVGSTSRALAKDASQQLHNAKANVLGVILNQADMSKGSYYNKYYRSYYGN